MSTWMRDARRKATNCISTPVVSQPNVVRQEVVRRAPGRLAKVGLPVFSGKLEEWSDFKRLFLELTQEELFSPCFVLANMRQQLPSEAVELMAGITDPEEAWKRLDRRYGNRLQAILHAKQRLKTCKVGSGPNREPQTGSGNGCNSFKGC